MNNVKNKVFFFPLWRGFSIRLLLKTGIIESLIAKGNKVVLLLPPAKEKGFWHELEGKGIIIENLQYDELMKKFKSSDYRWFTFVRYLTYGMKLFEKQGTNKYHKLTLWKPIKSGLNPRKIFNNFNNWLFYFKIKLIAATLSLSANLRRKFISWEKEKFFSVFHEDIYQKYNPDYIVIPSIGYSIDSFLMWEANHFGAKIVSYIQSWDNPSSKGYKSFSPDKVIVWNDLNKNEMINYHDIPEKNIYVAGVPHWDNYFNRVNDVELTEIRKKIGIKDNHKVIFFPLATPKLFRNSFVIAKDIADKIKSGFYGMPCQLILRLHPAIFIMPGDDKWDEMFGQEKELFDDFKKNYSDVVIFNAPLLKHSGRVFDLSTDDSKTIENFLRVSDALVNVYSTMAIEASVFDVPIINIGYYNYRDTRMPISVCEEFVHLIPVQKTKAVKNAYSAEELHLYLKRYLNDRRIDQTERKQLCDLMLPVNRGSASKAAADFISNL